MMALAIFALIAVALVIGVKFIIGLHATPPINPQTAEERDAERKAREEQRIARVTSHIIDIADADINVIAEAIEKRAADEARWQAQRREDTLSHLAGYDHATLRAAYDQAKAIPLYGDRLNALGAKNDGGAS